MLQQKKCNLLLSLDKYKKSVKSLHIQAAGLLLPRRSGERHSPLVKNICFHSRSTVPHLSQTLTWPWVSGWVTTFTLLMQSSKQSEWESQAFPMKIAQNEILLPSNQQRVRLSLGGTARASLITLTASTPWRQYTYFPSPAPTGGAGCRVRAEKEQTAVH